MKVMHGDWKCSQLCGNADSGNVPKIAGYFVLGLPKCRNLGLEQDNAEDCQIGKLKANGIDNKRVKNHQNQCGECQRIINRWAS